MTRIKQVGPSVLVVAIIAGVVGYILGCTRTQRENDSAAHAAQQDKTNDSDVAGKADKRSKADGGKAKGKPDEKYRSHYHPNTETLAPNEMRVIALGTGMPF